MSRDIKFMESKYGNDTIDLLMSMKTSYQWPDSELDFLIKDYKKRIKEMGNA